jgi:hypothetical protein
MKTAALAREMREAFGAMQPRDIDQVVGLGIPEILIRHFQMIGLARVGEDRSGTLWQPEPFGRWAYITPYLVQYADTPESTRPDIFPLIGNIVDLVAWCEKAPERWRLRTGAATWLGCIPPQYMEPEPVPIYRSPLSWLRHRCVGLVPLARERSEVYRLLAGCASGLIGEDERHAYELREILKRPFQAPPVYAGDLGGHRRAA